MTAEWKQEVLFVKRNEQGVIIQIEDQEPSGFESDVRWVQVEKPNRSRGSKSRVIGD